MALFKISRGPKQNLDNQTKAEGRVWVTEDEHAMYVDFSNTERVKLYDYLEADLSNKMDKVNPTGSGAVSINRANNTSVGDYSVAIGSGTTASEKGAIALGNNATATKEHAIAIGNGTTASGKYSAAIGGNAKATSEYGVALGCWTSASSPAATALGNAAVCSSWGGLSAGIQTTAVGKNQIVFGNNNIADSLPSGSDYTTKSEHLFILGNGSEETETTPQTQSNAMTVDWDGNAWFANDIYVKSISKTHKDSGSINLVNAALYRKYSLSGDLSGSASPNLNDNTLVLNGFFAREEIINSTDNIYEWHRIARVEGLNGQYSDRDAILEIRHKYNGGPFGRFKVSFRTNATGAATQGSVYWIYRCSTIPADSVKIAWWGITGDSCYADVFYKVPKKYARGEIVSIHNLDHFKLVRSVESGSTILECWKTIEEAATALHGKAYTDIQGGADYAIVNYANSAGTASSAKSVDWDNIQQRPKYYDAQAISTITKDGTTYTFTRFDGTSAGTVSYTKLPNPQSLILQINGTNQVTYDGSESKILNIPYAGEKVSWGLITNSSQTIYGSKTFNDAMVVNNTISTASLAASGAISAAGESTFTNSSYCSKMIDIASGVGASLKNARAVDDQLVVGELFLPYTASDSTEINETNNKVNELAVYAISGISNGKITKKTLVGKFTKDGWQGKASQLASSVNFQLAGAVTSGRVTFDGTSDVTLNTTIVDGSIIDSKLANDSVTTNKIKKGNVTNEKLANSSISIAGNNVSLGGAVDANTLRTSLGLSAALRFIGIATSDQLADNTNVDPVISGYNFANVAIGDVVIDKNSQYEYVWTSNKKWERLGGDSSYKVVQSKVSDPTASGNSNTFIKTITQDENGVITATKAAIANLSINGKTYNGSAAVNVGVIDPAYGGTGCNSLNASMNALINSLTVGTASEINGNTKIISQDTNIGNNAYYLRPASTILNYIKKNITEWNPQTLTLTINGGSSVTYNGKESKNFNIPAASATATGVVTTGNQAFAGTKTLVYPHITTSTAYAGFIYENSTTHAVAENFTYLGDKTNITTNQMAWRFYSYNSETPSSTPLTYYEQFSLPAVNANRTTNAVYMILTTKNYLDYATKITQKVLGSAVVGSTTLPVYYNGTKLVACNSTLGVSITGNAATATQATYVKDSYNGNNISITYGKSGQASTSWLASWNGYELGAISPSNLSVGSAAKLTTTSAGGSTTPVYFSNGIPVACKMSAAGARFNALPVIGGDGVMEAGKYIDFHGSNGATADYCFRLSADSDMLTTSGKLSIPTFGGKWLIGQNITSASINIITTQTTGSYHPVINAKTSSGHYISFGGLGNTFGFQGYLSSRTTNGRDWYQNFNVDTGRIIHESSVSDGAQYRLQGTSGAVMFYAKNNTSDKAISLLIGSEGINKGVYDNNQGCWAFYVDGNQNYHVGPSGVYSNGSVLYGACWNDYAEFRELKEEILPGYCVASTDGGKIYKTTGKFQACDGIVSDTYGFVIGDQDKETVPLAVAGRVLAYCEGDRYSYHAGDTVCAGPNGKVVKMTRKEICEWPDRVIGIVSEIPEYETWGENNISVDGRIWIKVR